MFKIETIIDYKMDTYESSKFNCEPDQVKNMLDKYGAAVVPNIIQPDQCEIFRNEQWKLVEKLLSEEIPTFSKNDTSTWKSFQKLMPLHKMMIKHWGVGHSQLAWDLRQTPEIVDVFAKIWNVNQSDLICSFDAMSFHLPPEVTDPKKTYWKNGEAWLHVDQSFARNNFECVQSFITLADTNVGDGTYTFIEGSNKFHKEFANTFPEVTKSKKDWYQFTEDELEFYNERKCELRRITCKAGSLVLWDSRTVHSGCQPFYERKEPNTRQVFYLCYTPRALATKSIIKKRIDYFENARMTNHWPHKVRVVPHMPRLWGKSPPKIQNLPTPEVTELGRRLIGYSD